MNLKNWSSCLKGGLIGLVVSVILCILLWLFGACPLAGKQKGLCLFLTTVPEWLILLSLFLPILIGIIVGIFFGKTKSKNKLKQTRR